MGDAADAANVANAAQAAVAASAARLDALENQFAMRAQNLQLLVNNMPQAPQPAVAHNAVPAPQAAAQVQAPAGASRRRLDSSGLSKLSADIDLAGLRAWKNRWADFGRLANLADYPVADQTVALRIGYGPWHAASGRGRPLH